MTEYADHGDLQVLLNEYTDTGMNFDEDSIWKIVFQVLMGLKVLHNHNILHRDIKPANIFINKAGVVKLGDFNISKVLDEKDMMTSTQKGTPLYAS